MKSKLILIYLMTIVPVKLYSQTTEHSDSYLNYHEHHKNEIGIGNSPVYFLKEKLFAYGLHIHYSRNIPRTKFGLGFGYERIFDEHRHNTFGLLASYSPFEKLHFALSPGLTFEDKDSKANFALHLETSYEYGIKNLHIGPVFEFAYDPEDFHLSLGLHAGFGF